MNSSLMPPPYIRVTTADLEVEERAQYTTPSSQADSLSRKLLAFCHEAGSQVLETASELLSEARQRPILPNR
eukprot:CAMPEP_0119062364 /NCGR_PEP_ID=MMETSP1178-20130426/5963_1 /TAXON_ID=33656 /ORGANISM="unid sp, Strain CCMP2000" /LENGTH=71 /DNA_ID=CAMNT_0007043639 /DNA_START=120 /DNA_END=335 /DNA_ORIENTATION=-